MYIFKKTAPQLLGHIGLQSMKVGMKAKIPKATSSFHNHVTQYIEPGFSS